MLKRTESNIDPPVTVDLPPKKEEGVKDEMPPPPPRRKRKRKHKRPNQGDTPHLQKWREFYKLWHSKHGEHETVKGMTQVGKAKAAGVAYRHSQGKKRATDPEEPEFPVDQ